MEFGGRYGWLAYGAGDLARLRPAFFPKVKKEATSCPPAPDIQSPRKGVEQMLDTRRE